MLKDVKIVMTGDCAVQVEFKDEITIETSTTVSLFRTALEEARIPGITETLQAYRSLMVHYKPEVIRYAQLKEKLEALLEGLDLSNAGATSDLVTEIPVYYGGEWAPDIQEVADYEGITVEEVIRRHSTNLNYLYFIGFSPGLPYLGNPEPIFTIPRRTTPRVKLPRGSVTVWREQTTVFPVDQPGGWNVIGRTPLHLFDLGRDPAFLLQAGQWVKFRPIDWEEYQEIDRQVEAGTYQVKTWRKEG